ncbi:C40 family peptidase [Streptomyces sp. NPDC001100]
MPHTAQIPSHRKPSRNTSRMAVRAGVASGVLGTLAMAGASGAANASEPVTQTLELPTLTADLAVQVAQSADATQQAATHYELQAERDAAAADAAKQAKADLADAQKKAEAKKKAETARKAAAEQATSRNTERTTLATSTTSSAPTSSSTATGSAAAVIAFAKAQIGDAYVLGATGPNSWDCSSLLQAAFKQAGISLPRVSQDQSTAGTPVSLSNLQPGDILYWGSAGSGAYHVALYVGGGNFVGAENPSTGIVERPLSWDPPTGAVRVL